MERLHDQNLSRPLGVVLGLALAVRLAFMPGIHASDDLLYRFHAHDMVTGDYVPEGHFKARVAFVAPLALCEELFGVNEVAAKLFPVACGLLEVAAVFWIGAMLAGRTAALAAGIVAATVPNAVFWGGLTQPDMPASAFMALAAAFWIRGSGPAAGLAAGMAYLQRESSVLIWFFFAAAWMMRRAPLRMLLTAGACSVAVLAVEMLYFWKVRGDPFGRFHAVTGPSYSMDVLDLYIPDLVRRLTTELPSMMFNPLDSQFPYFAATFLLLPAAAVGLRGDRRGLLPMLWWTALFAAILFFPIKLDPYRPAVVGHVKNLQPLVAPAAVAIGVWVAARRRAWAAVVAATAIGLLGCWILQADSARRVEGPRLAWRFVQERGGRCVTDPRTERLFTYWNKFGEGARPFPRDIEPGTLVVIDELWNAFLERTYPPYRPPEPRLNWRLLDEHETMGRRSLRRPSEAPGPMNRTRVYEPLPGNPP